MQVVPWEMRYKNYVDKEYNLYEDANRLFYDTLTQDKRIDELKHEIKRMTEPGIKRVNESPMKFTNSLQGNSDD